METLSKHNSIVSGVFFLTRRFIVRKNFSGTALLYDDNLNNDDGLFDEALRKYSMKKYDDSVIE